MYARKLNSKNQILQNLFYPSKYLIRQSYREYPRCVSSHCTSLPRKLYSQGGFISRYISGLSAPQNVSGDSKALCSRKLYTCLNHCQSRAYSSEGDEKNASDDKHIPVVEGTSFDKEKNSREKVNEGVRSCDAHAKLGELDQKEWLYNEKQTIERKKESPVLTRREKSKNEFLRRIVPWENITVSWETFPYYIHDDTKNVLVECAAAHIKHSKHAKLYGARLTSSNGRILLQSEPGTELYRERLVRALAQDLQVPLLVLDSSVLAPYDFGEDHSSDYESEGEGAESGGECTSESDNDEENDSANEDGWSNGEAKSDGTDPDEVEALANVEALKNNAEALEKFIPMVEHFNKETSSEGYESSSETSHSDAHEKPKQLWKKGDRVKYIGSSGADNSPLSSGRRGEVFEVEGDRVRVIFESDENKEAEGKDVEVSKEAAKPLDLWMDVKEIEQDIDSHVEDCYIAMEALHEVLRSRQPLIVYFPDSSQWLSRAVPKSNRNEFVSKLQKIFDELSGPVVLVCGQNKVESGSKEKGRVTMFLPNFARLAKLPLSLKNLAEGLKPAKRSETNDIFKLFTNVMTIESPKEEELLQTFNKQLEEDRRIIISRSNLNELQKVLEENELSCIDLLQTNTDGVILTKKKAEKVVGWAKNHYLASGMLPSDKGERLHLPRESLEVAISRVKEQDTISKKQAHNLKSLAKDEYETNFVSAVVPPGEIGVKFDDIGALEDVKKALHELVILPMRRPELFARGNLLRPCKGILLFGPPGTGKTLLAKALATEAGANFISITGSTLTSKWFGDAEKLTKALFSFASKLAPVIIFVDEVDSLLGARGGAFEHEATRRMRNEFMAAWDGLRTKDSQRILILGATNRPFDLDDAVIRRLPRRVYVDLPDAENRLKILRIFLAQENLESNFQFDKLANVTEGYSGSDLKNLCIAAAYRPVQELIEEESKGGTCKAASSLRSLNLDDFIQSKAKVGPSVSFDAASMNELRKWNEQYGEGGSRKKSPFGF